MTVAVGDIAPDFELSGTGDRTYKLSDYLGQPVVLAFYPADNSLVCTMQLNSYTEQIVAFEGLNAQVFGLSPQSVASHDSFAKKEGGFAFPLLADSDKAVAKVYGVLGPLGFYRRSTAIIDAAGIVRYFHRSLTGATFRAPELLVQELDALS